MLVNGSYRPRAGSGSVYKGLSEGMQHSRTIDGVCLLARMQRRKGFITKVGLRDITTHLKLP